MKSTWTAMMLLVSCFSHAEDNADKEMENSLHSIYQKYNQSETNSTAWTGLVEKQKANIYTIQKGDSLWNVSEELFGDPNYWPKIWSLNHQIENPHQIRTRHELHIVLGDSKNPSSVFVAVPGQESIPADKLTMQTIIDKDGTALSIPTKKTAPVRNPPASLPAWQFHFAMENKADVKQLKKRTIPGLNSRIPNYFISENDLKSYGSILETELGTKSAGEHQYIHVQLDSGSSLGSYAVYRRRGKLEKGELQSQIIEYQGTIQVLEKVSNEKNIFRARVQATDHLVEVGSFLSTEFLNPTSLVGNGPTQDLSAEIIGGEYGDDRSLFGSHTLVYLDSGKDQGVQLGSKYSIYRNQSLRVQETEAKQHSRKIGELVILHSTNHFSTGLIIHASDDIQKGDRLTP